MNKHFQELANIVARALARRWMQHCNGSDGNRGNARKQPPPAAPPKQRRRHLRLQQHK